ncbi:MAG: zinc ribbon domain-containing protein [Armatimonadetes bacterium]|nr:zinc ribbon domain-containing protein [Armatimonadota bacterium]
MTSKPTVFCSNCGAENPATRGACLLCYACLGEAGGGLPCPACGHDNSKDARFCSNCGNPFAAGATRVPGLVESALAVLHGGVAGLTARHEEEEEDYLGGLGGISEEEAHEAYVAPPPAPAAPPPVEEEEVVMPPSALDLQEAAAPPPAAAVVADEEDELPPPPPPAAVGLEDEDFELPPPPPPAAAFTPEAPATPKPAAKPAEIKESADLSAAGLIDPLAQASAEAEEEDFGDWSLDFPEEQEEEGKESS